MLRFFKISVSFCLPHSLGKGKGVKVGDIVPMK